jgi:hypothetical protein
LLSSGSHLSGRRCSPDECENGAPLKDVTLVNTGNGTAVLSDKPIAKESFTFMIVVSDGVLPAGNNAVASSAKLPCASGLVGQPDDG